MYFVTKNEYTELIGKFEDYKDKAELVYNTINDLDIIDNKYKDELLNCGEWLFFKPDDDGVLRFHSSSFCRKRICPLCQWRKSLKQFSNCISIADYLMQNDYSFLHVVLTVPNCGGGVELDNTIKKLYSSFGKLIKEPRVKSAFKGIMRCLEVSYNYDTHTYHPHLHCLVAVKKSYFNNNKQYISYARLVALWQKACASEEPYQVSIGVIKNNLGFAEVSKYCIKPLNLDYKYKADNESILSEFLTTLKGRRLIQCYGVIKEAKKILKLTDDTEDVDDTDISNKLEQMFYSFHYNAHNKKYEMI